MRKFQLHIFFILLSLGISHAQNKQIRAYNLADGLPQSQVYDIIQDNYGYIWLGTQGGGIARFDGKYFKVWNERKGLISNYIHSLYFENDSLYIGTKYGLTIKSKNIFANYKSPQINKIIKNGGKFLFATNKGLFTLKDDISLSRVQINNLVDKSIINDIKFINNWFWITTNRGLWKVSSDFLEKYKLSNFDFKSVINYGEVIIAGSYNKGVFTIDEFDNLERINNTKRINSLNILHKDELWIATDNAGITIINADTYKFIQKINKKNGLPTLHIRKTISDKQLNIWLATSGGIFKIFNNNFKHFDKNSGLKANSVYAITKWKNDLVFSNADEGLYKIDSLGLKPITEDKGYLKVKIRSLANDDFNNLFAGTDGKGVVILHSSIKDSVYTHLDNANSILFDTIRVNYHFIDTLNITNGLASNWVKKIHINNKIWVGYYASGISSFTYNSIEKEVHNLKNFGLKQGLKDLFINDITSDKQGVIWYATKNGHIGKIYKNRVYDLGKVLNENISIRTLLFHKEQLFIATSGKGIWWTNLTGNPLKFNRLEGEKELYSDNIYQLIFDSENHLWAGSENGVDKISLDKNNTITELQHFGRNDGFLGIETCLNAVIKDNKDNLWFGTINGLTKYQPTTTKLNQQKPYLFLEEVEVMNENLDSIPLQQFTKQKKILRLESNQNLLAFYFKTVDINHPKELQYRWKLDHSKWSNWNTDTKVNIASDYGKHTFQAQSRNINWIESDIISFSFKREKPLFKKTWFIWTSFTVLGLFFLSFIYLYFRRFRKKNKLERERLQLENNLLTLEQKALRLQMNPHFIFNVLNGIKAMSINDVKTMHKTINKFAALLRSTLINSRKNTITLAEEIKTLKNYIEVEQLMNEKQFSYQIEVKTEIDTEEILIPPMLIQPFIENAIRHGIMAVKHDGKLLIQFKIKNNFLYCTIIDNGIGINKSKENKPKNNHQSMALEVTKERIEHLSGMNTLIIEEITHKDNTLAGTKVNFKIPLITDY
jgi:ligand-binding sensor domain-containing protein